MLGGAWAVLLLPSPYHGVLAVEGGARHARLRLGGRLRPLTACAAPCSQRFRAIPPVNRSMLISQRSFTSLDASLLVRDAEGHYLLATANKILAAARQLIDHKMQLGHPSVHRRWSRSICGPSWPAWGARCSRCRSWARNIALIKYVEMFRGTIDSASVHPGEGGKQALRLNAAAIIISHNNPSGNPEPSEADKALPSRLKSARWHWWTFARLFTSSSRVAPRRPAPNVACFGLLFAASGATPTRWACALRLPGPAARRWIS